MLVWLWALFNPSVDGQVALVAQVAKERVGGMLLIRVFGAGDPLVIEAARILPDGGDF
ncbi:hypothetical protein [Ochrobactrum sp. CGA5]|uniref:hypothetical protein n=1 Tax=Ochrobactrum sp. CGA5 TaxID=2583453 RepID=UPI001AEE71CD|nr:hypothetical protein [Ochrobactrum sp. CGA5]